MGLLDSLKKFVSRFTTKKLEKPQKQTYREGFVGKDVVVSSNGDCVSIDSFEIVGDMPHRNGNLTNVILAKVFDTNINREDALIDGMEDYIAFEVANNMPITDDVLNRVAAMYITERNNRSNSECVYIGEVDDNPENFLAKKYASTQNYVDRKLRAEILNRKKVNSTSKSSQQSRHTETFDERNARTQQWRKEEDLRKMQRKQNPYIHQVRRRDNTVDESKLDGINVETGDFLRIRYLKKICEDTTGRYLYSAYLHNITDESAHEEDTPVGVLVCFTIDEEISDIVSKNNPSEINKLLQLLSQERIYRENNRYMNNIGTLDRFGNIANGEDNSQGLNRKIFRITEEARKEMITAREQFDPYGYDPK